MLLISSYWVKHLYQIWHSSDDTTEFLSSQFKAPKITYNSTSKEDINKFPVFNKFSLLANDIGDTLEAHISSSMKRKPTHSDDEKTLINPTSKRKDDITSLDTTAGLV